MTDIYDLRNPLTVALGDPETKRELTLTNNSGFARNEPITNITLPVGQPVVIQVIGDIGFNSIKAGIDEYNALKQREVITLTTEFVEEE